MVDIIVVAVERV
jgi:hypothetical protein